MEGPSTLGQFIFPPAENKYGLYYSVPFNYKDAANVTWETYRNDITGINLEIWSNSTGNSWWMTTGTDANITLPASAANGSRLYTFQNGDGVKPWWFAQWVMVCTLADGTSQNFSSSHFNVTYDDTPVATFGPPVATLTASASSNSTMSSSGAATSSTTNPSAGILSASTATSNAASATPVSINNGAIAGIVCGILLAFTLVGIAIMLFIRSRARRAREQQQLQEKQFPPQQQSLQHHPLQHQRSQHPHYYPPGHAQSLISPVSTDGMGSFDEKQVEHWSPRSPEPAERHELCSESEPKEMFAPGSAQELETRIQLRARGDKKKEEDGDGGWI